jgi:ribosome biogenesis GTPase A
MILEQYPCTILKSRDPHRLKIDRWGTQNLKLGGGDFWDDDQPLRLEENDPIRILLCGDTGVGKSTLINSVFGFRVVS